MSPAKENEVRVLSWGSRVVVGCATAILRAHLATVFIRVRDEAGTLKLGRSEPLIFCFWHNRMLLAPWLYQMHLRPRPGVVLTSPSRDGAYLDEVARHYGLRAVRGSTSKRGMRAMLELMQALEEGAHLGITPDGPRGPKYHFGPGAILLAQRSGRRIAPLHITLSRAWRLKSWDEFRIPKPFSRVTIRVGAAESIRRDLDEDEFERERLRLQTILCDATED